MKCMVIDKLAYARILVLGKHFELVSNFADGQQLVCVRWKYDLSVRLSDMNERLYLSYSLHLHVLGSKYPVYTFAITTVRREIIK